MNVCILGWYGSETLGDRAILDGIIKIFEYQSCNNRYYLGSLIPFFSERTLFQDKCYYTQGENINIELFCEKEETILKNIILKSDYVIMGGGPVMDISEILIIRKAFRYAKRHKIKTGLIGCGYGPFHDSYYEMVAKDILEYSDVAIFRDELSTQRALNCTDSIHAKTLCDPAIISALYYRESHSANKNDFIAVNFRDTRFKVYKDRVIDVLNELYELTKNVSTSFSEVKMVPMHTFFWGGDDRSYFAEMFLNRRLDNVNVIFEPQSLYELYETYSSALGCIGMRYHAIVLQTVLNGNNLIIDYTERETGKISGFLMSLNSDFYSNRYVNVEDPNWLLSADYIGLLKDKCKFVYSVNCETLLSSYSSEMF